MCNWQHDCLSNDLGLELPSFIKRNWTIFLQSALCAMCVMQLPLLALLVNIFTLASCLMTTLPGLYRKYFDVRKIKIMARGVPSVLYNQVLMLTSNQSVHHCLGTWYFTLRCSVEGPTSQHTVTRCIIRLASAVCRSRFAVVYLSVSFLPNCYDTQLESTFWVFSMGLRLILKCP
jgi:hypothetical protein